MVVDVDVHVSVELALFVSDEPSQSLVRALELVQHAADVARARLDAIAVAGCTTKRGRNVDGHRHHASPSRLSDAQVTLARVRTQRTHDLIRSQLARHRTGGEHGGARGDAREEAFLAAQAPRPRGRVLVANLNDAVDDLPLQGAGAERCAD